MILLIFTILCILITAAEFLTALMIIKENKQNFPGRLLNKVMLGSSVVLISYTASINVTNYTLMSLFNSIYFCTIDILLLLFIDLMLQITHTQLNRFGQILCRINRIYAGFDCIVLMLNPFFEIAIRYKPDPTFAGHWTYDKLLLYNMHLIFCYILVLQVIFYLISKIIRTPAMYRSRYSLIASGLVLIVVLNCFFLYLPILSAFRYDISVLLYGALCILVYYNGAYYSERQLLKEAPRQILHDLNHPVILFDYEKNFVINNSAADLFVPEDHAALSMEEFIHRNHLEDKIPDEQHPTSFLCTCANGLYRCDYQTLIRKESIVGYMFSFTETSTEYDILTGFHTSAAAARDFTLTPPVFPSGVMVCDISQLSLINETCGRSSGDHAIQSVADLIKRHCPEDSYLVRLHDANLMAICPSVTVPRMQAISSAITAEASGILIEGKPLHLISAFAMCTHVQPSVRETLSTARYTLHIKKLMDPESSQSSLLSSLARVLQEADPCTQEHVMRTRTLGEQLAVRMNLSEEQTANLALLCLLHDVGKLCVPLEILNKPGKLTPQEWELLKSHTLKGYQIASASRELRPVANLILHHHEFWDGSGYPTGLSREEIPLLSRIIAVIDSYDAMTHTRPYRKTVSCHQALLELERCAGTQFDPTVVAEFTQMIREFPDFLQESDEAEKADAASGSSITYDLTPAVTQEDPIAASEHMAPVLFSRYILKASDEMICSCDEHFEYLTGYTPEDVATGKLTQNTLIFPEDVENYNKLKIQLLVKDKEAFIEHRLRMKNGAMRYVCCHGVPFYDSALQEQRIEIIIIDMTESITVQNIIENEREIAGHNLKMWKNSIRLDPLTGLLNHTAFGNDLQEALIADNHTCAMLMCDIDFFKQYNDTKGHMQGDELLKGFAGMLAENVRDSGLTCRMGGDEFAVALFFPKDTRTQDIYDTAAALWSSIDSDLAQFDSHISISMGMTISVGKEKTFAQMYDESDQALYQAKYNGKHQLAFYQRKA